MRKALFLTLTLCVMASPLAAQSHFQRGDSNNDGAINIGDATYTLGFLFSGGPVPPCQDAADFNDDGALNIADAVATLGYLFSGGAAPAAPWPVFEADPTVDGLGCKPNIVAVTGILPSGTVAWTADTTYRLEGEVIVAAGTTLNIQAGTTILGDFETQGYLVVEIGGVINCNGNAANPVVFTSEMLVGSRAQADWGGVIILGGGANNIPGGIGMAEGVTSGGIYGGDPFDTTTGSGSIRYTRIEFGGTDISPNNEINALSMFGVNNETTFEYIQTKNNRDDGFEWFGGDADLKWGIASGIGDDSFDFSFGWSGRGQYWVAHHNDVFAETDKPDNGFEVDNQEDPLLYMATPRTNGSISNLTLVGDTTDSDTDLAFQWRRGCASTVINFIATGWQDAIIDIDDAETTMVFDGTQLVMEYGIANLDSGGELINTEGDATDVFGQDLWDFIGANPANGTANNVISAMEPLTDGFNVTAPNFRPIAGLPVGTNANTYFGDAFFDAVDYRGAVAPAGADWTQAPWISYQEN